MNKRIEDLAKDAGYKHPDANGECEDYAYFDHKKFAQLIAINILTIYDMIDNGNKVEGTDNFVKAIVKRYELDKK